MVSLSVSLRGLSSARRCEGQLIPSVVFHARVKQDPSVQPFSWRQIPSDSLFKDRRVILFAVSGAFLPLCSKEHLPGYEKIYDSLRDLDIHEVYCLAVNDTFVMRQWGKQIGLTEEKVNPTNPLNPGNFKKVKLLPDAEGHFTHAMGMMTHFEGIGQKSWRYSMIINNNVIEKLFIEQRSGYDIGGIPIEVSDSETMLRYLKAEKSK